MIDEEIDYILNLGVEFKGGHQQVDSLKKLLGESYDAIFVGSGAPRGRDLDIPGRKEAAANIHIGIDWLSSVSFGHIDKIGKRVIVLGGGNTAMDCCRTARRLGGEDVKVIVRSGFEEMKATPWEKEDAIHEDIPILNYLVPVAFTHENGKLDRRHLPEGEGRVRRQGPPQPGALRRARPDHPLRRRAGRGRPGERVPWIERDSGIEFDKWNMPQGRHQDLRSRPIPNVFFGGDAAFGPKNIIWAVAHGHDAALSIHKMLSGEDITERPLPEVHVSSQKMGIHEWSYDNDISGDQRYKVPHRDKADRAEGHQEPRSNSASTSEARARRGAALPELRRADRVLGARLHRMRRLRRHLPDGLHHLHRERRGRRICGSALTAPSPQPRPGALCRRRPQDRPRAW